MTHKIPEFFVQKTRKDKKYELGIFHFHPMNLQITLSFTEERSVITNIDIFIVIKFLQSLCKQFAMATDVFFLYLQRK